MQKPSNFRVNLINWNSFYSEILHIFSERHENQIIQSIRELQIVGEIEFHLYNGRRLQKEVADFAKNVNKRYFWCIIIWKKNS